MDIGQILVGQNYRVAAPNTSSHEWWVVIAKKQNKFQDWEITCLRPGAASSRIFKLEHFKQMKNSKEIISEGVELLGIIDGVEMWVERIDYMPFHERRGRKAGGEPKALAA